MMFLPLRMKTSTHCGKSPQRSPRRLVRSLWMSLFPRLPSGRMMIRPDLHWRPHGGVHHPVLSVPCCEPPYSRVHQKLKDGASHGSPAPHPRHSTALSSGLPLPPLSPRFPRYFPTQPSPLPRLRHRLLIVAVGSKVRPSNPPHVLPVQVSFL